MFVNAAAALVRCITYVVDGGGSVLSTGIVGDLYLPFACTIQSVTLLADQAGSVEVDIWSALLAAYPPTSGNSITSSDKPTITAATHSQDTALTGWTTDLVADSTLRFNINSISAIERLTIALEVLG